MKLLAIGTWDPRETNIAGLLAAEQQRTGELMQQGLVSQLLLRADGTGGYMVLNANSMAAPPFPKSSDHAPANRR